MTRKRMTGLKKVVVWIQNCFFKPEIRKGLWFCNIFKAVKHCICHFKDIYIQMMALAFVSVLRNLTHFQLLVSQVYINNLFTVIASLQLRFIYLIFFLRLDLFKPIYLLFWLSYSVFYCRWTDLNRLSIFYFYKNVFLDN